MPVNPAIWGNNLETETNNFYKDVDLKIQQPSNSPEIWRKFVTDSAAGLAVVPPFGYSATFNKDAFNPLSLGPGGNLASTAASIASAWANWFTAITWSFTPAPIPPFTLSVVSVVSNPATVAAAQATLMAGLMAEFAIIPPNPEAAKLKHQTIAALFYTATITPGVLISGIVAGAPPVPLSAPFPAL
jgi:hypothetical protein